MSDIIFTTSLVLIKMLRDIFTKCKDDKAVNMNFSHIFTTPKSYCKGMFSCSETGDVIESYMITLWSPCKNSFMWSHLCHTIQKWSHSGWSPCDHPVKILYRDHIHLTQFSSWNLIVSILCDLWSTLQKLNRQGYSWSHLCHTIQKWSHSGWSPCDHPVKILYRDHIHLTQFSSWNLIVSILCDLWSTLQKLNRRGYSCIACGTVCTGDEWTFVWG